MADFELNLVIPEAKFADALAGFLEVCPNITSDPNQWDKEPLSDEEWLRHWCKDQLHRLCYEGAKRAHQRNTPNLTWDPDLVTIKRSGVIGRLLGR